jgi:hypothetical protein
LGVISPSADAGPSVATEVGDFLFSARRNRRTVQWLAKRGVDERLGS